jgi:tetratricopeptide (TPR) repeat protein
MKKKLLSMGLFLIIIASVSGCSNAGNYDSDGKKSFVNGDYEEAAASFVAAIGENPNRADYYIDYGMALIALKKPEDALAQFELAYMDKDILVVKENNKRVFRGSGIAYYQMLQYEKAIKEFSKALEIKELSELDLDILYYIGNSMMMIGSYEEAINSYTSILDIDKKNAAAYSNRALCYKNIGDYDNSRKDYDMVISQQPQNYDAYFGKYYLLAENSYGADAAEVLALASEIEVKTSEDFFNQAKIHYYQGDYELALSELSEGFVNGFTEAYYYIGEIYRIQKNYPKAVYYYETFIKEGEILTPTVYNQIASCLIKSGDYKNAIKYLDQGIAYNHAGTMQVLMKNQIIAYESMGMFDKAKEKITQYLTKYPEDLEALREEKFIDTRLIDMEEEDGIE